MRVTLTLLIVVLLQLGTEAQLNAAGYRLLNANRDAEALEVFALVVRRHPDSANAWESYSEALENAGRTRKSLEAAQRALSLAPPPNVRDAAEARVKRLSSR